ncbi:MAG TPA: VOC family protein [Gammaproteobacteria bacterium]|jgi:predicted 3-demethylubiquinone-9 3-methyltransferase (glyoxalase superfamily)|nr:VOC family protein [Gammaproteobacteria bacterium]
MFAGEASAAMALYAEIFPSFRVEQIERYGPGGSGPEGTVKLAEASFAGQTLLVIDSPVKHAFTFTPAMSLFVDCDTRQELEAAFAKLSAGGQVLMPLGNYGFSAWFGWCVDRFGVSWQLNLP